MASARTRQFWIKIHRWLGLAAMLFLFIAAVTGCFLCFDKQIDAQLNRDLFFHQPYGPALQPQALVARLEMQRPDLVVTSFPLNLRPAQTLRVNVAPRFAGADLGFNELFINPSTGRVVGTRKTEPGWGRRHFVEGVFQLHQNLVAGTWGRWIMGVAALAWLIGIFVGLYLTIPAKKPRWPKWKKKWKFDPKARLRRFMLELHNASGLWLLIPAAILAYTSVAMNFFDEAFVPAVEVTSPPRASMFDAPPKVAASASRRIDFAQALRIGTAQAKADGLAWKPALERYNADYHVYGITFTDNGVENYHGLGPVTYYIAESSGEVVEVDDPYSDSTGRKLIRSLYPLHSGDGAGWFGIAIIFLVGLATAEMCVTGLYTWWKKRESRKPRKRAAPTVSARPGKA